MTMVHWINTHHVLFYSLIYFRFFIWKTGCCVSWLTHHCSVIKVHGKFHKKGCLILPQTCLGVYWGTLLSQAWEGCLPLSKWWPVGSGAVAPDRPKKPKWVVQVNLWCLVEEPICWVFNHQLQKTFHASWVMPETLSQNWPCSRYS